MSPRAQLSLAFIGIMGLGTLLCAASIRGMMREHRSGWTNVLWIAVLVIGAVTFMVALTFLTAINSGDLGN